MNNHLTHKPRNILVWMVGKTCIIITYMHAANFHISDQVNSAYNSIAEMAEAYTQTKHMHCLTVSCVQQSLPGECTYSLVGA